MVQYLGRLQFAKAPIAEGFAYPVKNHHGFIHGVTEYRQHGGQHCERELPLEESEKAEDDDHVMQVGDDRGDRELPLETKREVDHDADDHKGQRGQTIMR